MTQFKIRCKFGGHFPEKILMPCVLWIFSWKFVQMKAYIFGFQKMYTLPRVWAGELSVKSVWSTKMWWKQPFSHGTLPIFSQKAPKNCPKILNISNFTPLMQNILCALIELYLRNILIVNLSGNSENYKCDFFSWHTSQNWQKGRFLENYELCQRKVMFLTIRISSSM